MVWKEQNWNHIVKSEKLQMEGYCFKCKEKREMLAPSAEWAANGTPGTRGKCPVCGGTIYKVGHTASHDNLPKPEIKATPKKRISKKKSPAKANERNNFV